MVICPCTCDEKTCEEMIIKSTLNLLNMNIVKRLRNCRMKKIILDSSNSPRKRHLLGILLGLCLTFLSILFIVTSGKRCRDGLSKHSTMQALAGFASYWNDRYAGSKNIAARYWKSHWAKSRSTTENKRVPELPSATKSGQKSYISIDLTGRLGNNLFQYASLLGIASLNNKIPFVREQVLHLKAFSLSYTANIETGHWPNVLEGRYAAYDPQFQSLPSGNVTISNYLQSWKYFHHIDQRLRKELQFKEEYFNKGLLLFRTHTSKFSNRTVVAIHVRRSDMLLPMHVETGYGVAPLSYIMKAVDHMRNRFGNPVFLIASDDITWCEHHLTRPDMIVMKSDGNPYTDFVALTLCDHMIMTVGSYGWWAGWFINGHTVYYKDYPRKHSYLSRSFDRRDYFMPHWIPLGNKSC